MGTCEPWLWSSDVNKDRMTRRHFLLKKEAKSSRTWELRRFIGAPYARHVSYISESSWKLKPVWSSKVVHDLVCSLKGTRDPLQLLPFQQLLVVPPRRESTQWSQLTWVCDIWRFWRRNGGIKWFLSLLSFPVSYGGLRAQTLVLLSTLYTDTYIGMYLWAAYEVVVFFNNIKVKSSQILNVTHWTFSCYDVCFSPYSSPLCDLL